jgi:primosomal protein N' (replication factor Y) (superfamily II helicase)
VSTQRVRVIPDLPAISRRFDYSVPDDWHVDGRAARLAVGSMVRVPLHGRRVAAWVTELDPESPRDLRLLPLAKLSGVGPDEATIGLAEWASWRWAGPVSSFLGTASPPKMVAGLGPGPRGRRLPPSERFDRLFRRSSSVLRWPPTADLAELVAAAVRAGPCIVVVGQASTARRLGAVVQQQGGSLVVHPDNWALGAAGASVIGTRSAVWARVDRLANIVVIDEHAESMQEERSPTWHARDVAVERAERLGIPCVVVSPHPSVDALRGHRVLAPSRQEEREGWPVFEVVDRRDEAPTERGLYSGALVRFVRSDGRRVCVLNRTGRSQLLACRSCDDLASCDRCGAVVRQVAEGALVCRSCGATRPVVCQNCSSTSFKNLRQGVDRAREELEALVHEPVAEVTSKGWKGDEAARVVIGTEAVLHQITRAAGVAFLDFDQELLAPRFRAREQALAKLSAAARLAGPRPGGGRVLVQTRQPDNVVLQAVLHADPARVSTHDARVRQELGLPPFGGLARVSGQSAPAYAEALRGVLGLIVVALADDRFLVQSPDLATMLDALAVTPRPSGRLRVEIDPPDA